MLMWTVSERRDSKISSKHRGNGLLYCTELLQSFLFLLRFIFFSCTSVVIVFSCSLKSEFDASLSLYCLKMLS